MHQLLILEEQWLAVWQAAGEGNRSHMAWGPVINGNGYVCVCEYGNIVVDVFRTSAKV